VLAFGLVGIALPLFAQPPAVYPVRQGEWARSLNGPWKFRYAAGPIADGAEFAAPQFDAAAWAELPVPAHWELHGFAEPTYATTPEGAGYYRRQVKVPPAWHGRRIFLHFDGVLYGLEAWVNGRLVGAGASGYNPATFEITDALRADGDNLLAVRVSTRVQGWEFDTNDCWGLSGIYRDVTMFAVPAAHLREFSAQTRLQPDGTAELAVRATLSQPTAVSGRLLAPNGGLAADLHFTTDQDGRAGALLHVKHPQLWTAETPALYTLELTLASGQQVTERIGLREITVADGVLKLNGTPIKLRGVDHHDLWPVAGRVATEELMRRDLALMRAANINFIRTSHYPPHPRFLELCDELGFYVMDEVPFGFGESHLTDPNYRAVLASRAESTVRRDRNRPSVIVWSVGNENPNTPLTLATGRRVQDLDPSRPICFPQIGSYFATSYSELPASVELFAPHYPSTATVQEYATKLTRPIIFTEYAHALGLAADQIQAQWAVMQASPRIAGGAIWMFQDQGILRTATPTQTPQTSHALGLAVWPDTFHYYDTAGNLGMDGIVYSDRTPQVDYWQVRKVYSPVQIEERRAAVRPGTNRLTLHVANRFDFRALTGVALTWSLQRNGTPLQGGTVALQAAARMTEAVPVSFDLPADPGADVFTLNLACAESPAGSFYERVLRLDTLTMPDTWSARLAASARAGLPTLTDNPLEIRLASERLELVVQRSTGEVSVFDRSGRILVAGIFPHIGRRFTEAELMRAKKEQTWTGDFLRHASHLAVSTTRSGDDVTVHIAGHYARPDAPDQSLQGEMRLLLRRDGSIGVSYEYKPVNAQGLLLEAGLSVVLPTATEFRWIGDGPFPGYPGKDALNEFGLFHLNREDLRYQGNRRHTELALLTDHAGRGVALGGNDLEIAVENVGSDTVLSQNAVISGRGTKFARPDLFVAAESVDTIAGTFTVFALDSRWPEQLTAWFGPPDRSAGEILDPYVHSYDQ
jgi:beta-galactosidase